LEKMVNDVYVVLGSRFYMRDEHEFGIFQKVLRDNSIISMFDGSSVVNLHALLLQMREVTKIRRRRKDKTMEAIATRLQTIFCLDESAPDFDASKLAIFGRGADDSLQGLEIALQQLQELQEDTGVDGEMLGHLSELGKIVWEELNTHDEAIANSKFEFGHDQSPELFEMTRKYCVLHAAASCLHMWLYNRHSLGEFFARGEWLVLSLHRLLRTVRPLPFTISDVYVANVADELVKLYKDNKLFSIVPFQLAKNNIETEVKSNEFQLQY
jgi:hypothetical protein